jgi:hypothetical protein
MQRKAGAHSTSDPLNSVLSAFAHQPEARLRNASTLTQNFLMVPRRFRSILFSLRSNRNLIKYVHAFFQMAARSGQWAFYCPSEVVCPLLFP